MTMALWQSIPFASILLPLGSAAMTSVLKEKTSRRWTMLVLIIEVALSVPFLFLTNAYGQSYTYMMGHYPAPWGNEIRAGQLEAITAHIFALVMLLAFLGGGKKLEEHMAGGKGSLYNVMILLLTAALMAQVYTNDLFTAYVFVEIMTLAACSLIASRDHGRNLVAATRYMIMNLLGSGLFLLGVILLYDLTGHLLMPNIQRAVAALHASGAYPVPLTVTVALITGGLAIKSALFPFHTWVADAYSYATPTSSAILSSLVSKGYIFLLVKIIYRCIGLDIIRATGILDILFLFALAAIVVGSLDAIRAPDIRRMVAFSSVAQIGYIYMGIGLGTQAGMTAALFHIFNHAICKAMLFLAVNGLSQASGGSHVFKDLRGAGYRAPVAGVAFTIGALGMVGFPFLGGFSSKLILSQAAMEVNPLWTVLVLAVLIVSTWLNTIYFLRTVVTLYRAPESRQAKGPRPGRRYVCAMVLFCAVNLALGLFSQYIVTDISAGLSIFG